MWNTRIAGKQQTRWSIGVHLRMNAGVVGRHAEQFHAALRFIPWIKRVIAQTEIDGQAPRRVKIVGRVKAVRIQHVVFELAKALREGANVALHKTGQRIASYVGGEGVRSGRAELVTQQYLRADCRAAER